MATGSMGLAVATGACHRAPPPPRERPPATVQIDPPKERATTHLSAMGCSVQLPGAWSRTDEEPPADNTWWTAQADDGVEALSVLPLPWHVKVPQSELRLGLDDILEVRRKADVEQRGPGVVQSEREFVDDPISPGALYTTFDPDAGEVWATLVKATPNLACVFLLAQSGVNSKEFLQHAKSVLRTVVVEK
ncbi:hypothetical protein [Polyangium sp. 6x1]|uniref:hypothetical protein n=1 Tax=Polyangium sp. 6x1 TaxID=3042689 RepID=UPI002482BCA4|nr:hypothetical protein [Polyangium sp. 6x1]MDI1446050.1 hypothetical protein [Polyangium sp. 6x1]